MSLEGAKFICLDEAGNHGEIVVARGRRFTMGYYVNCDYIMADKRAKGVHCEIVCDPFGRVTIRNFSPDKPIYINGYPVEIKRSLLNNSKLSILDKQYLWQFPKTSSNEFEDLPSDAISTPEKQIAIPEQPPNSCPDFKLHRELPKRFTVHNFAYCIQSDEEGNTSTDSNDKNIEEDKDENQDKIKDEEKVIESNENEIKEDDNKDLKGKENENGSENRSVTPEPQQEKKDNVLVLLETPKMNLINCTKDKENNSTHKTKKQLLTLCHQSDVVITSFSPRETGVKIEKSFATVIKPKVLVTKPPTTPKSVYSTPKAELNDDDDEKELINFHTPSTSKKETIAGIASSKVLKNSSMHLIDLTTPNKLRPACPYVKSALNVSTRKNLTQTADKSSSKLPLEEQLGLSTLPSTPVGNDSNKSSLETPSSVISVSSTDTSSVVEVTSDGSMGITPSTTDGLTTPTKPQARAGACTPKRTPQSLMKRALLTSAKKQANTPQRGTNATNTPRRDPVNRIPLRNQLPLLGSPVTPKVSHLPRRQSMSTPTRKSFSARNRFDNSPSTSTSSPSCSTSLASRRSSINPISTCRPLPTSTPVASSSNSALHKVRKSVAGLQLSSHISKTRRSTALPASASKLTSMKEKSPQQVMSNRLVTRARKSYCLTPTSARAQNMVEASKTPQTCPSSILKYSKLERKPKEQRKAVLFVDKQPPEGGELDDLSRTFVVDSDEEENVEKKDKPKDDTFSPKKPDKVSDETDKASTTIDTTFSPEKKLENKEKSKNVQEDPLKPLEIPLDVEEIKETQNVEIVSEQNNKSEITEKENKENTDINGKEMRINNGITKEINNDSESKETNNDKEINEKDPQTVKGNNDDNIVQLTVDNKGDALVTEESFAEIINVTQENIEKNLSTDKVEESTEIIDSPRHSNQKENQEHFAYVINISKKETEENKINPTEISEHIKEHTDKTSNKETEVLETGFGEESLVEILDTSKKSETTDTETEDNATSEEIVLTENDKLHEYILKDTVVEEVKDLDNSKIDSKLRNYPKDESMEDSYNIEEIESDKYKPIYEDITLEGSLIEKEAKEEEPNLTKPVYEDITLEVNQEIRKDSEIVEQFKIQESKESLNEIELNIVVEEETQLSKLEAKKVAEISNNDKEIVDQLKNNETTDSQVVKQFGLTKGDESIKQTEMDAEEPGKEVSKDIEQPSLNKSEINISQNLDKNETDENTSKLLEEIEDVLNKSDEIKQKHLDEIRGQESENPLTDEFESEKLTQETNLSVVDKKQEVATLNEEEVEMLQENRDESINIGPKEEKEKTSDKSTNDEIEDKDSEQQSVADKNEEISTSEAIETSKEHSDNECKAKEGEVVSHQSDKIEEEQNEVFIESTTNDIKDNKGDIQQDNKDVSEENEEISTSDDIETNEIVGERQQNLEKSKYIESYKSKIDEEQQDNLEASKNIQPEEQKKEIVENSATKDIDDVLLKQNPGSESHRNIQNEPLSQKANVKKSIASETLSDITKNNDDIPSASSTRQKIEIGSTGTPTRVTRRASLSAETSATAEIILTPKRGSRRASQSAEVFSMAESTLTPRRSTRLTSVSAETPIIQTAETTLTPRRSTRRASMSSESTNTQTPTKKITRRASISATSEAPLTPKRITSRRSSVDVDEEQSKLFNESKTPRAKTPRKLLEQRMVIPEEVADDMDAIIEEEEELMVDKFTSSEEMLDKTKVITGEIFVPIKEGVLDSKKIEEKEVNIEEIETNATTVDAEGETETETPDSSETMESETKEVEKETALQTLQENEEIERNYINSSDQAVIKTPKSLEINEKKRVEDKKVEKEITSQTLGEESEEPATHSTNVCEQELNETYKALKERKKKEEEEIVLKTLTKDNIEETTTISTIVGDIFTPKSKKYVNILADSSKTPNMTGMRELLKTPRAEINTPKFVGMRNLLQTPKLTAENEEEEMEKLAVVAELVKTPQATISQDLEEDLEEIATISTKNAESSTPKTKKSVNIVTDSPKTPKMTGIRELLKTPKARANTPNLVGLRHLVRTPKSSAENKDEEIEKLAVVAELVKTPQAAILQDLEERDDIPTTSSQLADILTPKAKKSLKVMTDSPKTPALTGMRELLKTPKAEAKTPNLAGIRNLVRTPKSTADNEGEIEKLAVVAELVKTPQLSPDLGEENEPITSILGTEISTPKSKKSVKIVADSPKTPIMIGMRELLKTPKADVNTPKFVGIRQLVQTPKSSLETEEEEIEKLAGVADLVKTPQTTVVAQDLEVHILEEIPTTSTKDAKLRDIKELLKTPKICSTPRFKGMRELMKTPKMCSTPLMGGIKELMNTPVQQQHLVENDHFDKFLKTPTAKNIMIPSLPSSAIIEKSTDSIEVSLEYDLNATHEGGSANLEELFKTPVASRFVERITASYYGDDDEEQDETVGKFNKMETLPETLDKSAEEAFDKLVGQESQIQTPIRKVYLRKSLALQTPQAQSPFSAADVLSDLPKTDVEEWIETLDQAEPPTILEDDDEEVVEKENANGSIQEVPEKDKVVFLEDSIVDQDKSLTKNECTIPETCANVYLSEKNVSNVTTASEVMLNLSTVKKTSSKDPLASTSTKLKQKETRPISPIDAEISGIDLLDQTVESVQDEPSMLEEPLLVEEPSMFEEHLVVSDNDSEADVTVNNFEEPKEQKSLANEFLDNDDEDANDLSEPLLVSDSEDLSLSQECKERDLENVTTSKDPLEFKQIKVKPGTSSPAIKAEEKSILEEEQSTEVYSIKDPLKSQYSETPDEFETSRVDVIDSDASDMEEPTNKESKEKYKSNIIEDFNINLQNDEKIDSEIEEALELDSTDFENSVLEDSTTEKDFNTINDSQNKEKSINEEKSTIEIEDSFIEIKEPKTEINSTVESALEDTTSISTVNNTEITAAEIETPDSKTLETDDITTEASETQKGTGKNSDFEVVATSSDVSEKKDIYEEKDLEKEKPFEENDHKSAVDSENQSQISTKKSFNLETQIETEKYQESKVVATSSELSEKKSEYILMDSSVTEISYGVDKSVVNAGSTQCMKSKETKKEFHHECEDIFMDSSVTESFKIDDSVVDEATNDEKDVENESAMVEVTTKEKSSNDPETELRSVEDEKTNAKDVIQDNSKNTDEKNSAGKLPTTEQITEKETTNETIETKEPVIKDYTSRRNKVDEEDNNIEKSTKIQEKSEAEVEQSIATCQAMEKTLEDVTKEQVETEDLPKDKESSATCQFVEETSEDKNVIHETNTDLKSNTERISADIMEVGEKISDNITNTDEKLSEKVLESAEKVVPHVSKDYKGTELVKELQDVNYINEPASEKAQPEIVEQNFPHSESKEEIKSEDNVVEIISEEKKTSEPNSKIEESIKLKSISEKSDTVDVLITKKVLSAEDNSEEVVPTEPSQQESPIIATEMQIKNVNKVEPSISATEEKPKPVEKIKMEFSEDKPTSTTEESLQLEKSISIKEQSVIESQNKKTEIEKSENIFIIEEENILTSQEISSKDKTSEVLSESIKEKEPKTSNDNNVEIITTYDFKVKINDTEDKTQIEIPSESVELQTKKPTTKRGRGRKGSQSSECSNADLELPPTRRGRKNTNPKEESLQTIVQSAEEIQQPIKRSRRKPTASESSQGSLHEDEDNATTIRNGKIPITPVKEAVLEKIFENEELAVLSTVLPPESNKDVKVVELAAFQDSSNMEATEVQYLEENDDIHAEAIGEAKKETVKPSHRKRTATDSSQGSIHDDDSNASAHRDRRKVQKPPFEEPVAEENTENEELRTGSNEPHTEDHTTVSSEVGNKEISVVSSQKESKNTLTEKVEEKEDPALIAKGNEQVPEVSEESEVQNETKEVKELVEVKENLTEEPTEIAEEPQELGGKLRRRKPTVSESSQGSTHDYDTTNTRRDRRKVQKPSVEKPLVEAIPKNQELTTILNIPSTVKKEQIKPEAIAVEQKQEIKQISTELCQKEESINSLESAEVNETNDPLMKEKVLKQTEVENDTKTQAVKRGRRTPTASDSCDSNSYARKGNRKIQTTPEIQEKDEFPTTSKAHKEEQVEGIEDKPNETTEPVESSTRGAEITLEENFENFENAPEETVVGQKEDKEMPTIPPQANDKIMCTASSDHVEIVSQNVEVKENLTKAPTEIVDEPQELGAKRSRRKPTVSESSQGSTHADDTTNTRRARRKVQKTPIEEPLVEEIQENLQLPTISNAPSAVNQEKVKPKDIPEAIAVEQKLEIEQSSTDLFKKEVPPNSLELAQVIEIPDSSLKEKISKETEAENDTKEQAVKRSRRTPIVSDSCDSDSNSHSRKGLRKIQKTTDKLEKEELPTTSKADKKEKVEPLEDNTNKTTESIQSSTEGAVIEEDNDAISTVKEQPSKRGRRKPTVSESSQATVHEETSTRKGRRKAQITPVEEILAEQVNESENLPSVTVDLTKTAVITDVKGSETNEIKGPEKTEIDGNETELSNVKEIKISELKEIEGNETIKQELPVERHLENEQIAEQVLDESSDKSTEEDISNSAHTTKHVERICSVAETESSKLVAQTNDASTNITPIVTSIEKDLKKTEIVAVANGDQQQDTHTPKRGGRRKATVSVSSDTEVTTSRSRSRNRKTPNREAPKTPNINELPIVVEEPKVEVIVTETKKRGKRTRTASDSSQGSVADEEETTKRRARHRNQMPEIEEAIIEESEVNEANTEEEISTEVLSSSVNELVEKTSTPTRKDQYDGEEIKQQTESANKIMESTAEQEVPEKLQKSSRRRGAATLKHHVEHQEKLPTKSRRLRGKPDDVDEKQLVEEVLDESKNNELPDVHITAVNLELDEDHTSTAEKDKELRGRRGHKHVVTEEHHEEETKPATKRRAAAKHNTHDQEESGSVSKRRVGRRNQEQEEHDPEVSQEETASEERGGPASKRRIGRKKQDQEEHHDTHAPAEDVKHAEEKSAETARKGQVRRKKDDLETHVTADDSDHHEQESVETASHEETKKGRTRRKKDELQTEKHVTADDSEQHEKKSAETATHEENKQGRGRRNKDEYKVESERPTTTSQTRGRKRKQSHTDNEDEHSVEIATKSPETNVKKLKAEFASQTPQRSAPATRRGRKASVVDVDKNAHIVAESPNDSPSKRPLRKAATAYHNYDETSDSDKPTKKKTDSPRKSLEIEKSTPSATVTSASVTDPSPSSFTPAATTARGRTRKPTARVQQFLEEERAKAETPRKRGLLAAAKADTPTPQRMPGRRGRKASTIETDIANVGTPQAIKRGRGKAAAHNEDHKETAKVIKETEHTTPPTTTSAKGRRGVRKAKTSAEDNHDEDEPPAKKSPLVLEAEKQGTSPEIEGSTPTRTTGKRNAAAAAKARIEEDALAAAAIDPPKRARAKKIPTAKVAADTEGHSSDLEDQMKSVKGTKSKSSPKKREHRITSVSTVEGGEDLNTEEENESDIIGKSAAKRGARTVAASATTDSPAVPAKRGRKVKTESKETESVAVETKTTRGTGRGRKNAHLDADSSSQQKATSVEEKELHVTSEKSAEESPAPAKRSARARRK